MSDVSLFIIERSIFLLLNLDSGYSLVVGNGRLVQLSKSPVSNVQISKVLLFGNLFFKANVSGVKEWEFYSISACVTFMIKRASSYLYSTNINFFKDILSSVVYVLIQRTRYFANTETFNKKKDILPLWFSLNEHHDIIKALCKRIYQVNLLFRVRNVA